MNLSKVIVNVIIGKIDADWISLAVWWMILGWLPGIVFCGVIGCPWNLLPIIWVGPAIPMLVYSTLIFGNRKR
jgi:hypothetical protein